MSFGGRMAAVLVGLASAAGPTAISASAADLALPAPAQPTGTETLPFFVRIGGSAVVTDSGIRPKIAGIAVPGGGGFVTNAATAAVEAGYYVTPNVVASLAAGYPPVFAAKGSGTIAALGTLYKAQVGLPVFAITYRLDAIAGFRPYAGLGVGYAIVFDNKAAAVLSPHLHDSAAFVVTGGVDYDLTARWSVFVDVKKAFLTQSFNGIVPVAGAALAPVTARVRTDPVIVTTGLAYRF